MSWGNLFTEEKIKALRVIENKILEMNRPSLPCGDDIDVESIPSCLNVGKGSCCAYKMTDYCLATSSSDPTCSGRLRDSVLNWFYPSPIRNDFATVIDAFAPDGKGELRDVDSVVDDFARNEILFYSDKRFSVANKRTAVTRSDIVLALPLEGYVDVHDRQSEQLSKAKDFIKYGLYPELVESSTPEVRVMWYHDVLTNTEVVETVIHDSKIAMFAFIFVLCFMTIHLGSPFLSIVGMYGIVMSFPVAYMIYMVVFGYKKMMLLNFLSLYIIMGIGADDVFVFTDTTPSSIQKTKSRALYLLMSTHLWQC